MKSFTCRPLKGTNPAQFLGVWTSQEGLVPLITQEVGALESWGTPAHPGTWHLRLILNSLSQGSEH